MNMSRREQDMTREELGCARQELERRFQDLSQAKAKARARKKALEQQEKWPPDWPERVTPEPLYHWTAEQGREASQMERSIIAEICETARQTALPPDMDSPECLYLSVSEKILQHQKSAGTDEHSATEQEGPPLHGSALAEKPHEQAISGKHCKIKMGGTIMAQMRKRGLSLLLALLLLLGLSVNAFAAVSENTLANAVTDTAQYMYRTVKSPQVGSIGGEWAVLGLARSGYSIPETYYQDYYATVESYVKACGGVLHEKKYTEYSRVIVALSSIGKDARNVAGYDLTKALGDYDKTIWQGLNGPIWALIALDSRNYPMPKNAEAKTQATRQMYIDRILTCQLADGGWSLFGGTEAASAGDGVSDPDITGMALQALAKYQDQPAVKKATEEALDCMSKQQAANGGFASWGVANSESVVQMIVALCELGIPLDDARFVKNGNTMLDNLMTYYQRGSGFLHTADGSGSNQMASEQGFYGLVAAQRAAQGKNSLYRMGDAISVSAGESQPSGQGLEGKHADVQTKPITAPGKTFGDISGANTHANQTAIEALASRGIINGYDESHFGPDYTMTRAQFAAVVVRALGLPLKTTDNFTDVKKTDWCAGYVGTAYTYGIVNGKTATTFQPNGTITRQEAAVMVARAAKLCGMDTAMDSAAIRDVLAQFGDYVTTGEWARESLAFCYSEDILDQSDLNIQPKAPIKRCEIAQMVFNLLGSANLL